MMARVRRIVSKGPSFVAHQLQDEMQTGIFMEPEYTKAQLQIIIIRRQAFEDVQSVYSSDFQPFF